MSSTEPHSRPQTKDPALYISIPRFQFPWENISGGLAGWIESQTPGCGFEHIDGGDIYSLCVPREARSELHNSGLSR
jgi:hypothetical protein